MELKVKKNNIIKHIHNETINLTVYKNYNFKPFAKQKKFTIEIKEPFVRKFEIKSKKELKKVLLSLNLLFE